jgi:hypothetical protein
MIYGWSETINFLKLLQMQIKKGIPEELRDNVLEFSYPYFKHLMSKYIYEEYLKSVTNWDISALLVNNDGKMLGAYLLGNHQITGYVTESKYDNLVGVEGVLLVIDSSIRGLGHGNKLKDYPKTLGFDYIWGQQFKGLKNLDDWLKRRELVATTSEVYITAEIF